MIYDITVRWLHCYRRLSDHVCSNDMATKNAEQTEIFVVCLQGFIFMFLIAVPHKIKLKALQAYALWFIQQNIQFIHIILGFTAASTIRLMF